LETFQRLMSPKVSMMQLTHFLQLHLSGKFQCYDFKDKNLVRYDSPHPPEYDLSNITSRVYLYSASEDSLVSPKDVGHLSQVLPNAATHEILERWNHVDPMLGKNARNVLYGKILFAMNAGR
jgi:hypothetical protein